MPRTDVTKNYIRQRLRPPGRCDPRSFRLKKVPGRPDKKLVVCCPRGSYDPKTKKCRAGTLAQAKLTRRSV